MRDLSSTLKGHLLCPSHRLTCLPSITTCLGLGRSGQGVLHVARGMLAELQKLAQEHINAHPQSSFPHQVTPWAVSPTGGSDVTVIPSTWPRGRHLSVAEKAPLRTGLCRPWRGAAGGARLLIVPRRCQARRAGSRGQGCTQEAWLRAWAQPHWSRPPSGCAASGPPEPPVPSQACTMCSANVGFHPVWGLASPHCSWSPKELP